MKNTTLCYIERGGAYLMLHRVKKQQDMNRDKWIGIGGKFEENESPEDCLLREVREETGLTLTGWRYCGIVTFVSDRYEGEYMHLFHASEFTGTLRECDEGAGMGAPCGVCEAAAVGGRPHLPAADAGEDAVFFLEALLCRRASDCRRPERQADGALTITKICF